MVYQHIIVPIDGSSTSFTAIQHAASIAQVFKSKITVVQTLVLDPLIAADYLNIGESNLLIERAREAILKHLSNAQQQFLDYGIPVEILVLEGPSIHKEILNAATRLNSDLIIIGSHGHSGFKKLLLGSVAQSLVSEATIPVLVTGQSIPT